jgi:MFS family permease
VVGFGVMVIMAACNTVLQNLADDDKRGRVMSLYVASLMGVAPIGAILMGFAATWLGAPMATRIGGVVCVAVGALFGLQIPLLRPLIRPIYIRKGLVPAPVAVDTAEIAGRLKS